MTARFRDKAGRAVSARGVPLDRFVKADSESGRAATLRTAAIRDAWQRAIDRGYFSQPNA